MDPEFLNTENEHEHDTTVTSLSIVQPGDLDLDQVQAWMGDLLQNRGEQIYRMKGVLAIAHSDLKFVYQVSYHTFPPCAVS
jgi:G3E family GTPase